MPHSPIHTSFPRVHFLTPSLSFPISSSTSLLFPLPLSLTFSLSLSLPPTLQRKNGQINTLMKNHEKAFSDIKNYYNDITLNNLALINSLKVECAMGTTLQ